MDDHPRIRYDVTVYHEDDRKYLTLDIANLWREYSDWLDSVDPLMIGAEGEISLPSGIVKWRRLP